MVLSSNIGFHMYSIKRISLKKILIIVTILASLTFLVFSLVGCTCYGPRGWPGCIVEDGILYAGSMDGELLAIEVQTEEELWHWPPNDYEGDGTTNLFNCCAGGSSGASMGGGMFSAGFFYGSPVMVDGILYIGAYNGKVLAIDTNDASGSDPDGRELKWEYETEGPIVGGVTVSEGIVYAGSSDGNVYAINANDGTLLWEFETDNKVWSKPVVADGVVYFGSLDHNLYAVDVDTGELVWNEPFVTGGGIASTPLVVTETETVYIGSFDRKLYAVNTSTGKDQWDQPFSAGKWFWTEPLYKNGVVYACSLDHNVYALDATTGEEVWSEPFNAEGSLKATPVIYKDILLVVVTEQGDAYGINLLDGESVWYRDLQKEASVLAPLYESDDNVFVCAQNNKIYVVNAENGNRGRIIPLGGSD